MTRVWKERGLEPLRRNTEWFIQDSPSTIRLVPHKKVGRPGGTFEFVAQKARPAQDFRLIPMGLGGYSGRGGYQHDQGMEVISWGYHLIGKYNCEMEIGDTWTWYDIQYRIRDILPRNNWERRAFVTVFGLEPPENKPHWLATQTGSTLSPKARLLQGI